MPIKNTLMPTASVYLPLALSVQGNGHMNWSFFLYATYVTENKHDISFLDIYITKCTFLNFAPEGRTETLQLTYIPQMLAAYIQYKYIHYKMYIPGRIETLQLTHSPIVGMIYPTPIYKYNWHVFRKSEYKYKYYKIYIFVLDISCQQLG